MEQLWFTWTDRGLGSGRGVQIRAASERLADRRDRASTAARRYCYRPEGDRSFGWIDRDAYRIVFNRVDAGLDGMGREGNYFVHLVLGDPGELPAGSLWRLYDSSFWVTADRTESATDLPSVDAADLGLGDEIGTRPQHLVEFLAHVLHCIDQREGVLVPRPSLEVAELVAAAAAVFSSQYDVLSLSTGEGPKSAREFDVVCGADELRGFRAFDVDSAGDLPTIEAAETILDLSTRSQSLVNVAAESTKNRREYVRHLLTATSFRAGRPANPRVAVSLVTNSPQALEALLEGPGADTFADQVAHLDRASLAVLPLLSQEDQQRIAGSVLGHFDSPSAASRLLRLTVEDSPAFSRTLGRSVIEKSSKAGILASLPVGDRVEVVRLMAASGAQLSRPIERLFATGADVCVGVAVDQTLRLSWRAAAALASPESLRAGAYDQVLLTDVEFAREYLAKLQDLDPSSDLQRISSRLPPAQALRWLTAIAPNPGWGAMSAARWDAIDRVPHPDFLELLLDESTGARWLHFETWGDRLLSGTAGSLRLCGRSRQMPTLPPQRALIDRISRLSRPNDRVNAWIQVLDAGDRLAIRADFGRESQRLTAGISALAGSDREAAALFALDRAFLSAPHYSNLAVLIGWVAEAVPAIDPPGWPRFVLYAGLKVPRGFSGHAAGYAARWTFEQWVGGRLPIPGRDTEESRVLADVCRLIPLSYRQWLDGLVADWKGKYRKPAQQFLAATNPHAQRRW